MASWKKATKEGEVNAIMVWLFFLNYKILHIRTSDGITLKKCTQNCLNYSSGLTESDSMTI